MAKPGWDLLRQPSRRVLLVTAAMLVVACSGAEEASEEPSQTESAAATQVVKSYVTAVGRGDIDDAMRLRCAGARIAEAERTPWENQLKRLKDSIGSIEGVEARVIRSTGIRPVVDLPQPVEVAYRVVAGNRQHDELLAVTVREDGERRLCGTATRATQRLFEEVPGRLQPLPSSAASPRDLMPPRPPAGQIQIEDRERTEAEDRQPGELTAWTRAWQSGDYGGSRVTAVGYDSAEHALGAARHFLSKRIPESVDDIQLAQASHVGGVRLLGFAWLGVQPPDEGPYIDYVYAVYDRTMVVVAVANLPPGSDHELAGELLQQVHQKAVA